MSFDFTIFKSDHLAEDYVEWLVNEQAIDQSVHFEKLWSYYRNEMVGLDIESTSDLQEPSARPYRHQQEFGLPSRITGVRYSHYSGVSFPQKVPGLQRKEVVIENDIAWRIDTLVDFLFGKPISIVSKVKDASRKAEIESLLECLFKHNGSGAFFQRLALLGSIYGFVDVILRFPEFNISQQITANQFVKNIILETIEAPRALPVLDSTYYEKTLFYIQHYWQSHNCLQDCPDFIKSVNHKNLQVSRQKQTQNVEILGPNAWQLYENGLLIKQGSNPLGRLPVVHIQNAPLPNRYEGVSDVEPLIPLQDELNTRLSDRASRVTFQSFKMYLGKGIEGFENRSVAPGQMWSTENPDANIEEFGGDNGSPSEEAHLRNIREAMEKTSGVGSVAAGILTGKVGNLTSAVALQVTLMGLLSKTQRKRRAYGKGIADICELVLDYLNITGIFPNSPEERNIELRWPNPLPENITEQLEQANMKKQLGVPQEQILNELGY